MVVLLKTDLAADPGIVGLVPHTSVPIAHYLTISLLDAAPYNIGAALREPAHGSGIVERPAELGERDHRRRTYIEHRLHIGCKNRPLFHWIRFLHPMCRRCSM